MIFLLVFLCFVFTTTQASEEKGRRQQHTEWFVNGPHPRSEEKGAILTSKDGLLAYEAKHASSVERLYEGNNGRWSIESILCDVDVKDKSVASVRVNVTHGQDVFEDDIGKETIVLGLCGDGRQLAEAIVEVNKRAPSIYDLSVRSATLPEIFEFADVKLSLVPNVTRRRALGDGDCPSDDCAACLRRGSGSSCSSTCSSCSQTCNDCVSNGGGSACQSRCSTSTCTNECAICVENGGGSGCVSRCSPCGDVCTTCIQYKGGKACAQRCRSSTDCDSNDVKSSNCNDKFAPQFSASKSFTWSKSGLSLYSGNVQGANVNIVCDDCEVSFAPGVELAIVVQNNRLTSMSVSLTGDLDATAKLKLSASASAHFGPQENALTTLKVPSITFFVGAFPIKLDLSLPIKVGYQLDASASASVDAGVQFNGDTTFGVQYGSSGFSPTFSQSFSTSPLGPSFDGSASVTTEGWIEATAQIELNNFVRAGIALRPSVEAIGQLSSSSNVAVNGKFDATIEGSLGLRIANVNIPPQASFPEKNVYHYTKQIWHK